MGKVIKFTPAHIKAKVKKIFTKSERDSARVHISVTYRDATIKKKVITAVRLKLADMSSRDTNFLINLIGKHGRDH